jgi:YVTN family beta-propeller protein
MMTSELRKQRFVMQYSRSQALRLGAAMVLFVICIACGDTYRPVAQPIVGPSPNPSAVHFVYAISTNGNDVLSSSGSCSPSGVQPPCVAAPGAFSRIDVSGDSVSSAVMTGVFPVHAALTPDGSRYYVASSDGTISAGTATSGAQATTINLAQLCASGCAPSPVFVHSTETGKMYVADAANGTVSMINTTSNVVVQTIPVDPAFAGNPLPAPDANSRPVALAELPNGSKIFAANQGTNKVTAINTVDGSIAAVIPVSGSPVWAVAGADNIHIYVLASNGTISVISSLSNSVISSSASAGAGANFMLYDKFSNFLYVTNPAAGSVSVFDVSSDPPVLRSGAAVGIPAVAGSACTSAVHPSSVTVLGDGSRAYVASYQADANGAVCSQASVIDPGTTTVTKTIALPQSSNVVQTGCSSARFRVFAATSGGGKNSPFKVYVSQCDAGSVSVIDTFPTNVGPDPHPADVLMATVPSPVSSFPVMSGAIPPFENPVFLVAGP